jgi:hypothetical protein
MLTAVVEHATWDLDEEAVAEYKITAMHETLEKKAANAIHGRLFQLAWELALLAEGCKLTAVNIWNIRNYDIRCRHGREKECRKCAS